MIAKAVSGDDNRGGREPAPSEARAPVLGASATSSSLVSSACVGGQVSDASPAWM